MILITGSSGLIGTALTKRLLLDGREVLGYDCRLNTWSLRERNFEQQVINLVNEFELPEAVDLVVHLAAHAKVHYLVVHPHLATTNFVIASNVFNACVERSVPIIFSSSREVYGQIKAKNAVAEKQADFSNLQSPYAATKISAECLLNSFANCYGLNYCVLRLSNVYGKYDCDIDRLERVIPLFCRSVDRGETITVYGAAKNLDFTHVDDCVDGMMLAIDALYKETIKQRTFNIAYGRANTLANLVSYIEDAVGKKAVIDYKYPRQGEVNFYEADVSQARKVLGYRPKIDLKHGIDRAVDWYYSVGFLEPREV